MTRWEIFYGDGSMFSDEDGSPEDAPTRNVQCIVCADSLHGWVIVSREDFFVWWPEHGEWMGVDKFGLYDYLIEGGRRVVKFGRTLPTADFQKIHERAARSKRGMFDRKKQRRYPDMPHEPPP